MGLLQRPGLREALQVVGRHGTIPSLSDSTTSLHMSVHELLTSSTIDASPVIPVGQRRTERMALGGRDCAEVEMKLWERGVRLGGCRASDGR